MTDPATPLTYHRLRYGAGPALILLHGFPLDSRMWLDMVDILPGTGDVIALDLPAMGASASGPDVARRLGQEHSPSMELAADAVAATVRALGYQRVVVAGLSMGGYVLLSLLDRHPDLVAGAGLLDTKAGADGPEVIANRLRIADAVLSEGNLDAVRAMRTSLLGETNRVVRPDLVARLESWIKDQGPEGVAWCQRAMASRYDHFATLAGYPGPVAVIVGEQDELSPVDQAEQMLASARDGVLTVVPRAGHMTPIEDPEPVASALAALLQRASS